MKTEEPRIYIVGRPGVWPESSLSLDSQRTTIAHLSLLGGRAGIDYVNLNFTTNRSFSCIDTVTRADAVFVWANEPDNIDLMTYAELGAAAAAEVPVFIYYPEHEDPPKLPGLGAFYSTSCDAENAFIEFLVRLNRIREGGSK